MAAASFQVVISSQPRPAVPAGRAAPERADAEVTAGTQAGSAGTGLAAGGGGGGGHGGGGGTAQGGAAGGANGLGVPGAAGGAPSNLGGDASNQDAVADPSHRAGPGGGGGGGADTGINGASGGFGAKYGGGAGGAGGAAGATAGGGGNYGGQGAVIVKTTIPVGDLTFGATLEMT